MSRFGLVIIVLILLAGLTLLLMAFSGYLFGQGGAAL